MFRIIHQANQMPYSGILDPSAEFEAGQVAQFTAIGNNICLTVSDGRAPFGIIDDVRKKSFTNNATDEQHIIPVLNPVMYNGLLSTPIDIKEDLENPSILKSSFTARQIASNKTIGGIKLLLNERNGNVTIPAFTALNNDMNGDGILDSVRFLCSYTYRVPQYAGEDTTAGSGKVTIWYGSMIFESTMYETNQQYSLNAPLYVNEMGYFTSRKVQDNYPSVGMIIVPPNRYGYLQCRWNG